jgi:excisionase family DNA binding protein
MEARLFSTARVAQALGVSVSTVKRWVDENVLPAHRTPGGHRRILVADVVRLAREQQLPRLNLALLGVAEGTSAPEPAELARAFFAALRQGRGDEVRDLLLGAYQAGMSVEVLADQVIQPAMARLGHAWQAGHIDTFHEHRATLLCIAALHEVEGSLRARAATRRPRAVGGSPAGDPYLLASLLASLVLLDAGWEAVNLGPNTPLSAFAAAILELRPRLLWLSVSHLEDAATFVSEYRELYRTAEREGIAVVLGGQALTRPLRASLPYTTFGDGLTHLGAFARTLHPRPRPRQPGRPPGA